LNRSGLEAVLRGWTNFGPAPRGGPLESRDASVKVKNGTKLVATVAAALMSGLCSVSSVQAEENLKLLMKGMDSTAAPDLQWTEARSIPAGSRMILLYGDPAKPGPYVFRVQFPAGYKLPPHRHQDQRMVTVLKGNYWSAVGESFQQDKLKKFGARDLYVTDAGVPHFAWAETDVVIQESGIGPVSNPIEYVNAGDDPRK
jgi:quercetin dioxygenase-like cupin family protein